MAKKPAREHAYFTSLTIENIKCFADEQTLSLTDDAGAPAMWTIILGNNGSGKTTVLQALGRHGYAVFNRNSSDSFDEFIFVALSQRKAIGDSRYVRVSADFNLEIAPPKTQAKTDKIDSEAVNKVINELVRLNQEHDFFCFAYGTGRRMDEAGEREVQSDPLASLFADDAPLLNAEEWLLQLDHAASRQKSANSQPAKRLDQIKDLLVGLLPDVSDIRISVGKAPSYKTTAEFLTPDGWLRIQDLSQGYRTLTAWMVDFAARMVEAYPEAKNPLAQPAVCLVDEIDLHLHPEWQRKLTSYLSDRFPKTQFIVTAHSPLIVQGARDANIAVLKREEYGSPVTIHQAPDDIQNWRLDQIFTSDLFGLPSARPQALDPLIEEREGILSKSKLTKKDRQRLHDIEEEMGELPGGESKEDMRAMSLIRQAAKRMEKSA